MPRLNDQASDLFRRDLPNPPLPDFGASREITHLQWCRRLYTVNSALHTQQLGAMSSGTHIEASTEEEPMGPLTDCDLLAKRKNARWQDKSAFGKRFGDAATAVTTKCCSSCC